MFDLIASAFQTRAESVVVATTGSMDLAATATGYTRATGSFLTDGFADGMEITPSGFTTNAAVIAQRVEALTITVVGGLTVEATAPARTLQALMPTGRAYDNLNFTPTANRPWVNQSLVTGPSVLRSGPASGGTREDTGLFIVHWYALANTGAAALRKSVQAVAALFTSGTALAAGSHTVHVRGDVAPSYSAPRAVNGGWVLSTLSVPYRVYSTNTLQ